MIDKEKLSKLWNSIDANSVASSKDLFERNVDAFIEFTIHKTLDQEKFEVGLFEEGRQSGSTLVYKDDSGQKEIELRFKKSSTYDLILTLKDSEGEIYVFRSKVGSDETKLIPEIIQNLMYKVREIEISMTFFNSLTK